MTEGYRPGTSSNDHEFRFTSILWPDFDSRHLEEALEWFAARDRRFGAGGG
ncbi:undecaprenyl diphosphate synthase family protein [Tepidimonas sp.]|uniref:undecaprenyl diphosphate synthase family protein n=1 Tax=Tepidimonas sp. TaxID=2002775 RepID=UPI0039A2D149